MEPLLELCYEGEPPGLHPGVSQPGCDLPEYATRDLGLPHEWFAGFKIVLASPELRAIRSMDEVYDYTATITGCHDTTLDYVAQTQFRCCLTGG